MLHPLGWRWLIAHKICPFENWFDEGLVIDAATLPDWRTIDSVESTSTQSVKYSAPQTLKKT